ncbi:MAG TPA: serine hydrolase [Fimbriimonas sp.]|nr:serine hydrolase [Fimbriimonas sp.]
MISSIAAAITLVTNQSATNLPRSAPEAQGISSAGISRLIDELEKNDHLHSIMIVRHGKVVAEGWWSPYKSDQPHMLYSLSKSFTSTAIGMLIAEGKISLDDPIQKFFPEDVPANPTSNQKEMRIRDLLCMSTGHHPDVVDKMQYAGEVPLVKQFLNAPVEHKPGTLFYYNTPATFMLSAVVQKVTGEKLVDYLKPRLFDPLGIGYPMWETSPQGINMGGFGLNVITEDIAKFGQLYLQRGEWNGQRLLPAAWVDLATSKQASNGSNPYSDWDQGYGYQFWRCRPGFYRGDGAFGQYCIVMPQYDTVVAITSGTGDMGGVMNTLWERLLPELRATALPRNELEESALATKMKGLVLPTINGAAGASIASSLNGKVIDLAKNNTSLSKLSVTASATSTTVQLEDIKFAIKPGAWVEAGKLAGNNISVSGAWTSTDTLTLKVAQTNTPYVTTMTLKFAGSSFTGSAKVNVSFGGTAPVELKPKN